MFENLKEITDDSFNDEVISNEGLVIVDYYADWCTPCKKIGVAMEELSQEYSNTLKIVKGNVETNSATVTKFGINGVPAILMFKRGELVSQHIGLRSKKDLKKDIEEVRNV